MPIIDYDTFTLSPSAGRLRRPAPLSRGRTPGPVVRGRHRQLGRGVRDAQPAGGVRQRAHVHGMDRGQHLHGSAAVGRRRRVRRLRIRGVPAKSFTPIRTTLLGGVTYFYGNFADPGIVRRQSG